jgi:hypothetical protein
MELSAAFGLSSRECNSLAMAGALAISPREETEALGKGSFDEDSKPGWV